MTRLFKKIPVKEWVDVCDRSGWTLWYFHLFGFRNWCVGITFRTREPVRVKEEE